MRITREQESKVLVRIPRADGQWELLPLETSPCTLACPTRINARGYVTLIADGRFEEALTLIRDRNPFPGVCGRVCPRPCEAACRRGEFDEPIAICGLKRFVFDYEMKRGIDPAVPYRIHRRERIAVIGAGPAGLSAAHELVKLGYPVTIFDAAERPGGLMRLIPEFRLPQRVVDREVRAILGSGISIETNMAFGRNITWRGLRRRGFRALVLATGAARPLRRIDARGSERIVHALPLLSHAAGEGRVGGRWVRHLPRATAVVIGNGMLALDAARTALRLGCGRVHLVTTRSRELAPLLRDDLAAARAEGITLHFLARLEKLSRRGPRVTGVRCVKLAEEAPDATGRRGIERAEGSFEIEADLVVDASARTIDAGRYRRALGLELTAAGTLAVDGETMETAASGVFAAGDLVSGSRSVVEAIASGQKAARGVHERLAGERAPSPFDARGEDAAPQREYALERLPEERAERLAMPVEQVRARKRDFREVESGYTEPAAKLEARRCLRCGMCAECTVCTDICDKKDLRFSITDGPLVTVHAERDFWSLEPREVTVDLDGRVGGGSVERTICRVGAERCIGCGRCEEVCAFKAAMVEAFPGDRFIARVNEIACKGCGTCVSVCPTGAMEQVHYERARLHGMLAAIEPGTTKVLFVCRWSRPETLHLPRNVLVVDLQCTGRLTPSMIVETVRRGSPAIMVCGCREDACHYGSGRELGIRIAGRSNDILGLLGYGRRTVTTVACDPAGFHEAVGKWAKGRRR